MAHLDRTLVEPGQLGSSPERVFLAVDVIAIDAIGLTRIT
jgi:hypothetical protein